MNNHTSKMNNSNNFKQPEALRIAIKLEREWANDALNYDTAQEAWTELRRLYAENERLWKEREEPVRTVEMYLRECNRLEKERDQLLEALQTCIDYGSMTGGYWVTTKAISAIESVHGIKEDA